MGYTSAAYVRLFRSPAHGEHWVVYSERSGWMMFPARVNGWADRVPYPEADPAKLNPVPLWMGFNTGLLEAIVAQAA
jgi:hypothetical protein